MLLQKLLNQNAGCGAAIRAINAARGYIFEAEAVAGALHGVAATARATIDEGGCHPYVEIEGATLGAAVCMTAEADLCIVQAFAPVSGPSAARSHEFELRLHDIEVPIIGHAASIDAAAQRLAA